VNFDVLFDRLTDFADVVSKRLNRGVWWLLALHVCDDILRFIRSQVNMVKCYPCIVDVVSEGSESPCLLSFVFRFKARLENWYKLNNKWMRFSNCQVSLKQAIIFGQ
jgi:hypothetical protein